MGMAQAIIDDYISPEEYLTGELIAEARHEYVAGVVYAMSGTSQGHWRIVTNISRSLDDQLADRCQAFSSEIKVRIHTENAHFYYYPDVVVDCGPRTDHSFFADEPKVIFEVLSPSTARTDRTEKRLNYQKLPTLDVYVLVDQSRRAITVYRRAEGEWTVEVLAAKDDVVELPTIRCALPLIKIYERTDLATE